MKTRAGIGLVFCGGMLGTLLRYGVNQSWGPQRLWAATLMVNLVGAFALGLLVGWVSTHPRLSPGPASAYRLLLGTGMLGGFTTYSTFASLSANYQDAGDLARALGYGAATVGIGLLASAAGLWAGRRRGQLQGADTPGAHGQEPAA